MTRKFRDATPWDMPSVLAIEAATQAQPWRWDERAFARHRREISTSFCVVDGLAGEIAGFVVFRFDEPVIYILRLSVCPHYRDQGVGSFMVDFLKGRLGERFSGLSCVLNETNLIGQCFLRKHGFTGRLVPNYFGERDGITFGYVTPVVPDVVRKFRSVFTT